jgi:hypothetical protein
MYCVAMEKGAGHLVIQKNPSLKIEEVQKQTGKRYMVWTLY